MAVASSGLWVEVDAPLRGGPLPAEPPGWRPGLWEFDVVELFVGGTDGYLECELGPGGHHWTLRFRRIREAEPTRLDLGAVAVVHHRARWRTGVTLPWAWLPDGIDRGIACAIHGHPPERTYEVSARLPGAQPDFHQPAHWPLLPADLTTRLRTARRGPGAGR
jgi:hypothetical protein